MTDRAGNDEKFRSLALLHREIGLCRVCETQITDFQKPPHLDRGEPGHIIVIGQGPGHAELNATRAFAGQAGRTLDKWLVACGAAADNPRGGIYFTSVIKCVGSDVQFGLMAANCASFLQRQILEIRPALVITLGKRSFDALTITSEDYNLALCKPFNTADTLLVTAFDFHYSLLHWPHPSGRNRWLNVPGNRDRLNASFDYVRKFLRGES